MATVVWRSLLLIKADLQQFLSKNIIKIFYMISIKYAFKIIQEYIVVVNISCHPHAMLESSP